MKQPPGFPSDAQIEATSELDRVFFGSHHERKHYVRVARPDEMRIDELVREADQDDASLMRRMARRFVRYRNSSGEVMQPLTVVRQLVRYSDEGHGVRLRTYFQGIASCLESDEYEARFIWDECNKDQTVNGVPVRTIVSKMERELAVPK